MVRRFFPCFVLYRFTYAAGLFGLAALLVVPRLSAQTESATVLGRVTDPTGAVVNGVAVEIRNIDTNVATTSSTNAEGLYAIRSLPPGRYVISVHKQGFKTVSLTGLELNVQDDLIRNFVLPIGAVSESITVNAESAKVNTTDASISTVIDRRFVENTPLNGRSFQSLILLSPGVVSNTPQASSTTLGSNGEFSVNGQRTESNYYSVDGVSANIGVNAIAPGAGSTGSVPAATALGTTQSLVSVDALEEFRVSSSTYSAEYGRSPGGQFSLVTRAGTNQWHGTAFDYLRNDVFDANNWFNDFFKKAAPPLRQNDFGGTFGGPVVRNKTFFFFSYEGLRLTQPQAASISYVPTATLRQNAPAPLQQVLNAFPVANGPDQGNGLAQFIGTWSNPASLNAYSVRFDHNLNDKLKIFFRFSDTDSNSTIRSAGGSGNLTAPSTLQKTNYTLRSYTVGASSAFSDHLVNELRFSYASNTSRINNRIDGFGGAQPVDLAQLVGIDHSAAYDVSPALQFGAFSTQITQQSVLGQQRQWNVTDSIANMVGRHQLKFGIDYRRLTPVQEPAANVLYFFFDQNQVQANNAGEVVSSNAAKSYPLTTNFSAFAQDEWRITERLNVSLGLRWEVNPATGTTQGPLPLTVQGVNNLSTMKLAPAGTPLWKTTWYNFAPRLGAAYVLRGPTNHETVVRGGGGVYFDTGQQSGAYGFTGPNYQSVALGGSFFGGVGSFPQVGALPPINQNPAPPYAAIQAYPAHLQLPYTIQWNVSVDQALGTSQAISLSYVGSHAARLLEKSQLQVSKFNPNFSFLQLFQNGSTADYDALQVQFRRRIGHGLNALASYTWGHSIDYGSTNLTFPYVRGNSDFDVRHTFSSAFAYELPGQFQNRALRMLFRAWGLDDRLMARSGFPVSLLGGGGTPDPVSGQFFYSGLNLVAGQPFYIYGPQFPGGRSINPAAFHLPTAGQPGNAPRNFIRGFGAWQMDVAARRDFPITEKMKLQFRAEAFNVFNHPNFGFINPNFGQPTFGQATSTLNNSPGILSSLYQMGGPRSMQFALKLAF
jgi:hypothetical protein